MSDLARKERLLCSVFDMFRFCKLTWSATLAGPSFAHNGASRHSTYRSYCNIDRYIMRVVTCNCSYMVTSITYCYMASVR
jgi:hypothetical protein